MSDQCYHRPTYVIIALHQPIYLRLLFTFHDNLVKAVMSPISQTQKLSQRGEHLPEIRDPVWCSWHLHRGLSPLPWEMLVPGRF